MAASDLIASRLLSLAAGSSPIDRGSTGTIIECDRLPLADDDVEHQVRQYAGRLVDELFEALTERTKQPELDLGRTALGEGFSLGLTVRRAPIRRTVRGFIEPVRRAPLVERLPDQVALYLISIPGARDFLHREQHGFGWHYHYLDARRRRSDILLCWDTRWKPPANPDKVPARDRIRPLFQEKHAEGRREFPARPELWRDPKKESMYVACEPDLHRHISEFRCAADKADVVWPPGKSLTPRSSFPTIVGALSKRAKKI